MTDFYLLAAERSCSAQSLVGQSYRAAGEQTAQQFLHANGFAKPGDRLMRGELFAVPSLAPGPQLEPGRVGQVIAKANFHTRNQRSEPAAQEFNANFGWLREMVGSDGADAALKTSEGTLAYFEKRADSIAGLLTQYKRSYEVTARSGGANFLNPGAANSARHFIARDLQTEITGVTRRMFLEKPHRSKLQDQLGISHKALKNQVNLGKNLKELEKIEQAAVKARKLSSHLKRGGMVVRIAGAGSTVADIHQAFEAGGARGGVMKTGQESFKAAGGLVGGRLGGAAGGWAAGAALAVFGVGTGGLGFVAVAIGGVVIGSIAGGAIGESVGDAAWGEWGNDIYTMGEDAFELLVKKRVD